jgi:radical SAM superfamily enzyme YgiQ (UPF0313 family)
MRFRPVEEVVEEIERRRIDRFFLTDDNFGLAFAIDPEYSEKLFWRWQSCRCAAGPPGRDDGGQIPGTAAAG